MTEILELVFLILLVLASAVLLMNTIIMFVRSIHDAKTDTPSTLRSERPERPRDKAKDWLDNKRGGV